MSLLYFTSETIVWQEVPNETSLAFLIAGCPLRCQGCHSAESWREGTGKLLSETYLRQRLAQYQGLISCVLFMGGEWQPMALKALLGIVQSAGLKTCLYTGLEYEELCRLDADLCKALTFLKTGRWIAALGGLDSPYTNQRLIDLRNGRLLNSLFWRKKNEGTKTVLDMPKETRALSKQSTGLFLSQ
ncbi:MAG: anaerobic ribonucleoside-triphosphate reductase activating protein [Cardiobacteriaceae bacterium]|nr:anaerobic ribonucleoside-triphosphate reductase activating protein [Cardiobacteriaceae bacterium]